MFSMVVEFRDPATVAIPFTQRDEFRRVRDPPDDWRVWIGRISPNRWHGLWHHTGIGLFYPPTPDIDTPMNVQITTAAIGKLLIHTFRFPRTVGFISLTDTYATNLGLASIWPMKNTPPSGPIRVLTDDNAEHIASTLEQIVANGFAPKP
jgi:hypothetical protein